jgi:uncharacterized protein YjbI with pentapeptide repeats
LVDAHCGDVHFRDADSTGVNLSTANLSRADLSDDNLEGAAIPDGTFYSLSLKMDWVSRQTEHGGVYLRE